MQPGLGEVAEELFKGPELELLVDIDDYAVVHELVVAVHRHCPVVVGIGGQGRA